MKFLSCFSFVWIKMEPLRVEYREHEIELEKQNEERLQKTLCRIRVSCSGYHTDIEESID